MAQWVLQQNGQIVPCRTLRRLRQEETSPHNLIEKAKRDAFDSEIRGLLGDSVVAVDNPELQPMDPAQDCDFDIDDFLSADEVVPEADAVDATGRPINQQSVADMLINAEVLLDHGGDATDGQGDPTVN